MVELGGCLFWGGRCSGLVVVYRFLENLKKMNPYPCYTLIAIGRLTMSSEGASACRLVVGKRTAAATKVEAAAGKTARYSDRIRQNTRDFTSKVAHAYPS